MSLVSAGDAGDLLDCAGVGGLESWLPLLLFLKESLSLAVVAHTLHPSTWEAGGGGTSEFKARTARATQGNTVKQANKQNTQTNKKNPKD